MRNARVQTLIFHQIRAHIISMVCFPPRPHFQLVASYPIVFLQSKYLKYFASAILNSLNNLNNLRFFAFDNARITQHIMSGIFARFIIITIKLIYLKCQKLHEIVKFGAGFWWTGVEGSVSAILTFKEAQSFWKF